MRKRLFSVSLAVCMLCHLTMTACSAADIPEADGKMGFETAPLAAQTTGFTDVPQGVWYADGVAYCQAQSAVRWAESAGVLDRMTADRRFAPKTKAKRGEIAAMLYRYLSREQGNIPESSAENLVITVGGRDFAAALEDNASTRALVERLPLTVDMGELNGNARDYV